MSNEEEYWHDRFTIAVTLAFSIFTLVLIFGALAGSKIEPVVSEEAFIQARLSLLDVFINNMGLGLLAVIPFIGPVLFSIPIYGAGLVNGSLFGFDFVGLILVNPIFWLEFVPYALLGGEALLLSYILIQDGFQADLPWQHVGKTVIASAMIIFTGSIVEVLVLGGGV